MQTPALWKTQPYPARRGVVWHEGEHRAAHHDCSRCLCPPAGTQHSLDGQGSHASSKISVFADLMLLLLAIALFVIALFACAQLGSLLRQERVWGWHSPLLLLSCREVLNQLQRWCRTRARTFRGAQTPRGLIQMSLNLPTHTN